MLLLTYVRKVITNIKYIAIDQDYKKLACVKCLSGWKKKKAGFYVHDKYCQICHAIVISTQQHHHVTIKIKRFQTNIYPNHSLAHIIQKAFCSTGLFLLVLFTQFVDLIMVLETHIVECTDRIGRQT